MHVSTNQNGSIVWCIDRNGVAHYRIGIKEAAPQGKNITQEMGNLLTSN